jgi:hypothetical protein
LNTVGLHSQPPPNRLTHLYGYLQPTFTQWPLTLMQSVRERIGELHFARRLGLIYAAHGGLALDAVCTLRPEIILLMTRPELSRSQAPVLPSSLGRGLSERIYL